MTKPTDPPPFDPGETTPEGAKPVETWPASSVFQKIQEVMEDYENGYIREEDVVQFIEELNIKDEENFLKQMDEYNDELRERLRKIDIANRALQAANAIGMVEKDMENMPEIEQENKEKLTKSLNESVVNIKDPGDAKEVVDQLEQAIQKLEGMQKGASAEGSKKIQDQINAMKDIAMGLRVDYLGSTRTSLGTGVVLQGPLGEVLGLGFDKLQVEADNDGAKYISGYIATQRLDLATDIRSTANNVKNRPQLTAE